MIPIIQKSNVWYAVSGALVAASIVVLAVWRLTFGIDFTGGSLLTVAFAQTRPEPKAILETLQQFDLGEIVLQNSAELSVNMRFKEISEDRHRDIVQAFVERFPGAQERRFEFIGGTIGRELKTRSLWMLCVVLVCILLYIAWSFRHVSRKVSGWQYGVTAIVALFHDVLITLGVFSVLGHYLHLEVGAPFIAAVLTVLAYSVNDTIVVFDRIRENLIKLRNVPFEEAVNTSVNQTMYRSVNTSLTILLSLAAIFFFGGESIKYFVLTLIVGISVGTYSSIFLASPVLVSWGKRSIGG